MSTLRENKEKLYDVIKRPLITEKTVALATKNNQYTFEVNPEATKVEIKQAIELAFPGRKVKSVKTVYMPSHAKRMGRSVGRTQSSKKAVVLLEGDPIEELRGV